MKMLKVCIILIFLSVLGFIVYRSWNKNETEEYKTISLSRRDINEAIYIPGNVFPSKEIEIKSQLSGILDSIYVKIGDYVEAGAPIASIKLVPNASDIERLENNLNVAHIDYDARLTEYSMEKRLFEANIIAKAEMDEYTRAYKLAKENLISAQNQLDILKQGRVASKNISNIVHSSTVGTVIDIPYETGASVIERNNYNPGTTIAIVAETNLFKFKTLVAEQYLKYLVLGDSVSLTFNAYQNINTKAVVTKISSKGNEENGIMKYLLDADFEIKDDMPVLRSGYSATAEIVLNSCENVLSVEEKYIIYRNDSTYLNLLDKTGKKMLTKNVRLGISDGVYTEIIDGVNAIDRVITNLGNCNHNNYE
jgi:HlyD family secretion protein